MIILQSIFEHEVKGQRINIELKTGMKLEGTLEGVDRHMNFLLSNITLQTPCPLAQTEGIEEGFVRGNMVAQISIPSLPGRERIVAATRAVYTEQQTETAGHHSC